MNNPDTCNICNRSKREHEAAEKVEEVHHGFAAVGDELKPLKGVSKEGQLQEKIMPIASGPPTDPALRILLINKGLISVEELDEVQNTLRVTGVYRTHGHSG